MKAEIKFANTSNGPKAFVKTFDDDWTPMSTPLKAYKKDMRRHVPFSLQSFLRRGMIIHIFFLKGEKQLLHISTCSFEKGAAADILR